MLAQLGGAAQSYKNCRMVGRRLWRRSPDLIEVQMMSHLPTHTCETCIVRPELNHH